MKSGTLIAVVVLGGYIGLEAFTIRQASYRTEPDYIYQLLIEAEAAALLCNHSVLELQPRFERTLARVTDRYMQKLNENRSETSLEELSGQLEQQSLVARQSLEKTVAEKGCSDPELKAHFQRYRIYAKKTR